MTQSSNQVRWGIMSTAAIAAKVCQAMKRAGNAQPVAVASRSSEKAAAWAAEHGVPTSYGSYEELLSDPDVNAVYIPLPPSMHHEWTIKAAEAQKHVLCEKPLAGNITETKEMIAACKEHAVQLMDGVMWVHHDRTRMIRDVLDAGELGELKRVTAGFSFRWDEVPTDNIRVNPDLAGGCLGDLGYYCVQAILFAFQRRPRRVFATARYYNDIEMNLSAILWFNGEQTASFDCGFDTVMRQWFEIAGTKKSLVCDDFVLPWSEDRARFWVHDDKGKNQQHEAVDCVQEVNMIERFGETVLTNVLDDRWPSQAYCNMLVCDALSQSARTGKIVEIED